MRRNRDGRPACHSRWSRLVTYDDPVAWVRRVALNLATSNWRRLVRFSAFARREPVRHVPEPSPDRVTLVRALATLPARQRRAIVLHYLADLSIAEIADQERVAPGTVKAWLHRARTALAAARRRASRPARARAPPRCPARR